MQWDGFATYVFSEVGNVRAKPLQLGIDTAIQEVFARGVLPVVMLARGCEALHASAVKVSAGIIALCGVSGTGKSTTALALAHSGLGHYADDTLVFRFVGDRPVVVRLPFQARADGLGQRAGRTPATRVGTLTEAPCEGPLYRIYHLRRDTGVDPFSPVFVPVEPADRFPLLLTHAHPFDMGTAERRRTFLTNLMTLARVVEVWECRFAPDLRALPSLAAAIRRHASE